MIFEPWVTFELWVSFEIWLTFELQVGGQTEKQTDKHTHRQINTMTRPDLGDGSSENMLNTFAYFLIFKKKIFMHTSVSLFFSIVLSINLEPAHALLITLAL